MVSSLRTGRPMNDRETTPNRRGRTRLHRALIVIALLPIAYYALCVAGFIYLRFLPPVTTAVQLQRAVERIAHGDRPVLVYRWRGAAEISEHLPRAVVAAEDARFYQHNGFDWEQMRKARERARTEGTPMRGASTLTHQLIKNLYFTTHRNPVRKIYEWGLTPPAEWILGKDRIVLLYVNVVEFGPGIFGAHAAARHHYDTDAADLSRYQAASLAAVLPAPRQRQPASMGRYTEIIQQRMSQMGW